MGKARIDIPREKIAEFCKKWKVREFALFGSVLREDFRPDSDIDAIVDFMPDSRPSLFDLVDMTEELEKIFDRKVDLLTRRGVEESRNYIRRKEILSTLEVLYVS
ncbi:MAG: nucleotidyltransferase domain-containing protein [Deltaproteobacteria bacterium]|nr:nucleotidyltransferase domain-containing protein [Deltaproteobacteria bacterium]